MILRWIILPSAQDRNADKQRISAQMMRVNPDFSTWQRGCAAGDLFSPPKRFFGGKQVALMSRGVKNAGVLLHSATFMSHSRI